MVIDPDNYDPAKHHYFTKQTQLIASGAVHKREITHLWFRHDDWCGIYKKPQEYCDCEPDVEIHGGPPA